MKYDYKAVEAKWQKVWEDEKTFHAEIDHKKPKFYALVEFPYPSGAGLHVGHPRSYTALDVVSRKRRKNGYNVLYPMLKGSPHSLSSSSFDKAAISSTTIAISVLFKTCIAF